MLKILLLVAGFAMGPAVFAADMKTDAVMNALTRELDRSFNGFRNAEKVPLYFLGYEIIESGHTTSAPKWAP